VKKSIRIVVFLFVIAMLPGLFQGFSQGVGSKQGLRLNSMALAFESVSLDKGSPSTGNSVSFDAAGGSFNFIDDASVSTYVEIRNFTSDDHITIINADANDYAFVGTESDVTLSFHFNNNGTMNIIKLVGILNGNALVYDLDSLETALNFNAVSNDPILQPPVLSLNPAVRNVRNDAGTTTFSVSNTGSGTMAWTASVTSGSSWLSITSGASGTNSGTINLQYSANTGTSSRTGTIRVTSSGAAQSPVDVTVVQDEADQPDQGVIILSKSSPNLTVSAGSQVSVYGTAVSNDIALASGAKAELINFPGSNSIEFQSDSSLFTVSRSGTIVTFQGSDGTELKMPATDSVQTISFADREPLTLSIYQGQVMLDDQVVTSNPDSTITEAIALIGSEGGVVEVTNTNSYLFGTKVSIAQGTFNKPSQIHISLANVQNDPELLSPTIEIESTEPITKDLEITLPLNETYTGADTFAFSMVYNPETSSFESSGKISPLNHNAKKITFKTSHLSIWSVKSFVDVLKNTPEVVGAINDMKANYDVYLNQGCEGLEGLISLTKKNRNTVVDLIYGVAEINDWCSDYIPSDYLIKKIEDKVSTLIAQGSTAIVTKYVFGTVKSAAITMTGKLMAIPAIVAEAPFALCNVHTSQFSPAFWGPLFGYYLIEFQLEFYKKIFEEECTQSNKCGAFITPTEWKEFDCYNLGAAGRDTHPWDEPSWKLIGGYWQWGRKGPVDLNTNTEHFAHGPTGPGDSQANNGSISGWSGSVADSGSWYKDGAKNIENDPCPTGFRVPTIDEWKDVLANNEKEYVGDSWTSRATNYDTGLKLGESLFLPAAGYRYHLRGGALGNRGYYGYYWSSSELSSINAWYLSFDSSSANASSYDRRDGFSVRCVAE
jgi:uncharacterized protein (TIGR02145 family)